MKSVPAQIKEAALRRRIRSSLARVWPSGFRSRAGRGHICRDPACRRESRPRKDTGSNRSVGM